MDHQVLVQKIIMPGLAALTILFQPVAAQPIIVQGSDYLSSSGGSPTQFDFGPGVGLVEFHGNPIGPGGADTIVKRLCTIIGWAATG